MGAPNILIDANTLYQKDCGSKTYAYNLLKEFLILSGDAARTEINIDICGADGKIFSLESRELLDETAYKGGQNGFVAKLKKSLPRDSLFYPYVKSFYRTVKRGINILSAGALKKKGRVYDIFWTPYQMEISPYIAKKKFITVHDIFALSRAENYLTKSYSSSFKKYLDGYLPFFDGIFTVSEFTKTEFSNYFNYPKENIYTIYNGFDSEVYKKIENPGIIAGFKEKYGIGNPFLLYAGAIEPRKNILNLLKAYKGLLGSVGFSGASAAASGLDLILVSNSSALAGETYKLIKELGRRVKIFKGVSNEELALFYNAAEMFVFPSFCEGFGIPPIEAFACGTPVAASNFTAIPEICGDGAYYFDPRSVEDIKNAILTVLNSPSLKAALIKKGAKRAEKYSYKKSAAEILSIFLKQAQR